MLEERINNLSKGYFFTELIVKEIINGEPNINHEFIVELEYKLDTEEPIFIKIKNRYFKAFGSSEVKYNEIQLPYHEINKTGISYIPKKESVLIPKNQSKTEKLFSGDLK